MVLAFSSASVALLSTCSATDSGIWCSGSSISPLSRTRSSTGTVVIRLSP